MPNRNFNKQVTNSRQALMAGGRAKKNGRRKNDFW